MKQNSRKIKLNYLIVAFSLMGLCSCEKSLDVDLDKSKITNDKVFNNDVTATAAGLGMYFSMCQSTSFAGGSIYSISMLAGLSADELVNNSRADHDAVEFDRNELTPVNANVLNLWTTIYSVVYQANAIMEGVEASAGLSDEVRIQLKGEALFVRALCNFYLVNLFDAVPLITTTEYAKNAGAPSVAADNVYDQIIDDLTVAKSLLKDDYPGSERIRINEFAAAALLARVYLYRQEWEKAASEASVVIDNGTYALEDPANVFLSGSKEAILQLKQPAAGYNTWEAQYFNPFSAPSNNVMPAQFLSSFESGDQRLLNWIGSTQDTIFFPFKYKVYFYNQPLTEYSVVIRLAEQHLIRAEARVQLNDISGAQADLNLIRHRAGLGDTPADEQNELISAILQERKVELFSEWGHRWLDLKRLQLANTVLAPIKPSWNAEDILYPIPQIERDRNTNLTQNPGY